MGARETLVYLNGVYVGSKDARVSVYDSAFLHGMAVFETVRIDAAGQSHDLPMHLDRLWDGCRRIAVEPRLRREAIAGILAELVQKNGMAPCRGRIMVSRGPEPASGLSARPTELIALLPQPAWPAAYRVRSVPVSPGYVPMLPVLKSSGRIENILLTEEAQAEGFDDALFVDRAGRVLEGPSWNVFAVRSGRLVTPPLDLGILPGTVRRWVLENLIAWDTPGGEEAFTLEELISAEEAFITSSTRGVIPLVAVDGREIGNGKPGPTAPELARRFQKPQA